MANVDNPRGFRAIRNRDGSPYNGVGNLYHVASGDSQVIAPGDPVVITGTADAYGIPTVTRWSSGAVTGIMAGVTNGEGTVLQNSAQNTVASTSQYILVHDGPDVVFEGQCDGGCAVTDIGSNATFTAAASPSDGKSGFEVDSTSFATTATLPLKILRYVRREDNEVGTNGAVEVLINNHTQDNNIAGI